MLRMCSRRAVCLVGLAAIYLSILRLTGVSSQQQTFWSSLFTSNQVKKPTMLGERFLLTADVATLRAKLNADEVTSVDLVSAYLEQIEQHNLDGMGLRAVISTAPTESVLSQARQLDEERKEHGSRGPFHGIPIIVKDIMLTEKRLGMDTTCGTAALIGAKGRQNADVVDAILKAGMIIIGKANLSELNLFKASPPNTGGWSSAGGQGLSPYVTGGVLANATFLGHSTPAGSSSGSAVAVAAGFAPISLGAEADGSLVQPTSRAGLFALKPEPGSVSLAGIMGIPTYDCIGPIAKTARDVADMLGLLLGKDFSSSLTGSWTGLSVGLVNYDTWAPAPFVVEPIEEFTEQAKREINEAASKISASGAVVVRDVPLPTFSEFTTLLQDEHSINPDDLWGKGFAKSFDDFMSHYETANVRSLAELVEYHKEHADVCLPEAHPSQAALEDALEEKEDSNLRAKVETVKKFVSERIKKVLADSKVDVIITQSDGRMASVAAAAGFAVAALPLGYADFNGRAWGVNAVAGPGGEAKLLEVMSAWDMTFPESRKSPPQLVDWSRL